MTLNHVCLHSHVPTEVADAQCLCPPHCISFFRLSLLAVVSESFLTWHACWNLICSLFKKRSLSWAQTSFHHIPCSEPVISEQWLLTFSGFTFIISVVIFITVTINFASAQRAPQVQMNQKYFPPLFSSNLFLRIVTKPESPGAFILIYFTAWI